MKISGFDFLNAQRRRTQNDLQDSLRRLSSGRLNTKDNPAAAAISQNLRGQSSGLGTLNQGITRSQATLQVAEGGLSSISGDLQRLREIAVQASNGTLSDADRSNLQNEFDQIVDNIDSTAANTNFGGQSLLDGSFSQSINTSESSSGDVAVNIDGASASDLYIESEGVSTQGAAQDALAAIDSAIDQVNSQRASIGATQNRLDSSFEANAVQRENVEAAASQLSDVDLAEEISTLTRLQIQAEAQTRVQQIQQDIAKTQNDLLSGIKKRT